MKDDANAPSLLELLDRSDLSHMQKAEIVRLHAEAERAEYVAGLITGAARWIKGLFVGKKPAVTAISGVRHA